MGCGAVASRRAHGPGGHLWKHGGQLIHLGVDGSTGSHLEVILSSGGHLEGHLGAWAVGLSLPEGPEALEVIRDARGRFACYHQEIANIGFRPRRGCLPGST